MVGRKPTPPDRALHADGGAAGLVVAEVVHRRAAPAVGGDEELEVVRAGRGLQRLRPS